MKTEYDIVVVGGGPAGSALALAVKKAAPDLRVAILERSHFDAPRAGETIPPQCRVLLERLGVWEAFLEEGHLPAYGSQAAWGSPQPLSHEFLYNPQRNGWHLDRSRFDAFLARCAADAGADLHLGQQFRGIKRMDSGGWLIELQGREQPLQAKLVVDATGRYATLARSLGEEVLRFDRLTGIMAVLEAPRHDLVLEDRDTLIETVGEGWWYSALLPGQKMAVAMFTDVDITRKLQLNTRSGWLANMESAPHTFARITPLLAKDGILLKPWSADSQRLSNPIGKDWIAVGDAAAAFDPLSSQGIFFALRSALMGAFAVLDLLQGGATAESAIAKYSGSQLEQYVGYWEVRRAFYQLEQRWPESDFWMRRHGRVQLAPQTPLAIQLPERGRPLFFGQHDLARMRASYPQGAPAHAWLRLLAEIRPDLPAAHALEGLQALILDGHAQPLSNPVSQP